MSYCSSIPTTLKVESPSVDSEEWRNMKHKFQYSDEVDGLSDLICQSRVELRFSGRRIRVLDIAFIDEILPKLMTAISWCKNNKIFPFAKLGTGDVIAVKLKDFSIVVITHETGFSADSVIVLTEISVDKFRASMQNSPAETLELLNS